MTPYHQGRDRPIIQVKLPGKEVWIVWNWDTVSWDRRTTPLGA